MHRYVVIAYNQKGVPFGFSVTAESIMDALFRASKDRIDWLNKAKSVKVLQLDSWDDLNESALNHTLSTI